MTMSLDRIPLPQFLIVTDERPRHPTQRISLCSQTCSHIQYDQSFAITSQYPSFLCIIYGQQPKSCTEYLLQDTYRRDSSSYGRNVRNILNILGCAMEIAGASLAGLDRGKHLVAHWYHMLTVQARISTNLPLETRLFKLWKHLLRQERLLGAKFRRQTSQVPARSEMT